LFTKSTRRNPNGMEPSRYATLITIRDKDMVASGFECSSAGAASNDTPLIW
jgi:hypothetical protein